MSHKATQMITLLCFILLSIKHEGVAQNPYVYLQGTCWLPDAYDIITSDDPSAMRSVSYTHEAPAQMWDREANDNQGAWGKPLSWIYRLIYVDGITASIRVRQSGFSKNEADSLAQRYAFQMGQLPACLRKGTALINIMKGDALYGGNIWNHSIDITIGKTSQHYHQTGNMEEILFHEATHASLDYLYEEQWATYSNSDPKYISKYAADNPTREDISESFLLTSALALRPGRIPTLTNQIERNLPNRINFLQSLSLSMYPFAEEAATEDLEEPTEVDAGAIYYRLTCSWLGEGRSLTVVHDHGANQIQLTASSSSEAQHWKMEPLSGGYFRLTNRKYGAEQSLDVVNDQRDTQLQLAATGDFTGQFWLIKEVGGDYYRLTTMFQGAGKSLDVVNDGQNNKLQLAPSGNYSGQLWKLTRIE